MGDSTTRYDDHSHRKTHNTHKGPFYRSDFSALCKRDCCVPANIIHMDISATTPRIVNNQAGGKIGAADGNELMILGSNRPRGIRPCAAQATTNQTAPIPKATPRSRIPCQARGILYLSPPIRVLAAPGRPVGKVPAASREGPGRTSRASAAGDRASCRNFAESSGVVMCVSCWFMNRFLCVGLLDFLSSVRPGK